MSHKPAEGTNWETTGRDATLYCRSDVRDSTIHSGYALLRGYGSSAQDVSQQSGDELQNGFRRKT